MAKRQDKSERAIAGRLTVENAEGQDRSDEEGAPLKWGTRAHFESVINEGGSVLHNGEIIDNHRAIPSHEQLEATLAEREAAADRGVGAKVKELRSQVEEHDDRLGALEKEIEQLRKAAKEPEKDEKDKEK